MTTQPRFPRIPGQLSVQNYPVMRSYKHAGNFTQPPPARPERRERHMQTIAGSRLRVLGLLQKRPRSTAAICLATGMSPRYALDICRYHLNEGRVTFRRIEGTRIWQVTREGLCGRNASSVPGRAQSERAAVNVRKELPVLSGWQS